MPVTPDFHKYPDERIRPVGVDEQSTRRTQVRSTLGSLFEGAAERTRS